MAKANNPDYPPNDGKIGMPKVDAGMNKISPASIKGGKGSKRDSTKGLKPKKTASKPEIVEKPPLSESNAEDDYPDEEEIDQDAEEREPEADGDEGIPDLDPKEKEALLSRIRKRMDRAIQAESDNRKAALDDLKFKKGDQWPADIQAQRNFDKRPCLTVNKMKTFVHQITNEQRQNRPAININPVGDKGDVEVAKFYRGLIRSIERASSADIAYDTAFDGAVSNGFGYFRILTDYEDADDFNQVLSICRIRNPFTVYLDDQRQQPDGSDSKWGFVTEMIPRDEFTEEWPWADPMPFTQGGVGESMKQWVSSDTIRVAEYYEIEMKVKVLVKLSNGHVGWEDELSDETKELIASKTVQVIRRRNSQSPVVHWYKVTAKDVLDHKPTVFDWIPIIPVIGDEIDIDGKVTLSGVVRDAKDPQRMFNYWRTSGAELIALAPKAPWIMEEGQVEGHEQRWKQANTKSYPYLLYKGSNVNGTPTPPPQRQPFAGVPAGVTQAAVDAAQDMMATTGIRFDATMQERTNDESGRALRELRRSGDIGSFHYIDNLGRSLKHAGRILVNAIPKVYDQKRMLTILREDDSEETVQIDPNGPKGMMETRNPANGKIMKIFNPTYGKYGVTVTIGPSYATKRIEAAESMMQFATALPNTASMIADLIAKNQDWPGATEIASRLAKVVAQQHPGIMSPDMRDVPPQVQAILTQMDQQIKQLGAERVQLMKALSDKEADRAVQMQMINNDFEAKMLKVVADVETKTAATHQRAVSSFETHISAEVKALGGHVQELVKSLGSGATAAPETASA